MRFLCAARARKKRGEGTKKKCPRRAPAREQHELMIIVCTRRINVRDRVHPLGVSAQWVRVFRVDGFLFVVIK